MKTAKQEGLRLDHQAAMQQVIWVPVVQLGWILPLRATGDLVLLQRLHRLVKPASLAPEPCA
ncbi:MAG: hypothetical protein RMJ98_03015 [Myxococcales bacterium]|nr:hypothetical protein [Polyangiaceae bacterium]MDW8248260.1 hypothetical protein [Myxococcales bacterium]